MKSQFEIGETVILNNDVMDGLPDRVGERAVVINVLYHSPNYDYDVEFDDSTIAPVKYNELNMLTPVDKKYMDFIFTGNKVNYLDDVEVTIIKCDYLNRKAEIKHEDESCEVVDFMYLGTASDVSKVIESLNIDSLEESPRATKHRKVIEEIHNTFNIKNADYGNSFGEQFNEYGLLSAVIRLDDKMRRLKQLMKQDAQVKDESIRDTVLDMANYAIMTVMELDKEKCNVQR
jgi:hypothetical protein